MNNYVVIRDMSAGNESVGEMWQETKIFADSATLGEVMEWAMSTQYHGTSRSTHSNKRITITKPHEEVPA